MFRNTTRCKLMLLAGMAMLIGAPAYAQEHGAGITKSCGDPVRTCNIDDDCADDNECTVNVCDTTNTNTIYNCTFTVTNLDDFEDTLRITSIQDSIQADGGNVVVSFPDLKVDAIIGNASCTDVGGGVLGLPCLIGPPTDFLGVGRVRFRSNTYEPSMDDPNPLPDQATGIYFDECDGLASTSCNVSQANNLQASSQQSLETGCTESPLECDDGLACTTDSCDEELGCVDTPVVCEGDLCNPEECSPDTGLCVADPVECEGDLCNPQACDLATGQCGVVDPVVCDESDLCAIEECDVTTGECIVPDPVVCDESDLCAIEECDVATGECIVPDPVTCTDDECLDNECDPTTGQCVVDSETVCDDLDACTIDSCDPETGCVHKPDPACGVAICRTPGFWGSHGGEEKNRSQNITQDVIDSVGGLNVCGVTIDNTGYYDDVSQGEAELSAIEAMCVSVKGVTERQLVRQLTAAALNCVMSGGDSDCVGGPIEDLFADCNAACVGDLSDLSQNACIDQIDCFNNGGAWDGISCVHNPGVCQSVGGFGSQDLCDADDLDSCDALGESCQPDPGYANCHEAELCQLDEAGDPIEDGLCFEPPGPAGSSGACNAARKNSVYVGDY